MLNTRLPFQKHLQWLCLEGLSAKDIQSYYDGIQMATPSADQIEAAQEAVDGLIMPPITRRRLQKHLYHDDDVKVWSKYGFGEIYLHTVGKTEWPEIGRILNHPVMRVALECCLVARVNEEEISQLLPSVYSLPLTVETISVYRKYFFDFSQMTKNDWQGFLDLIVYDRYTHQRLFYALTRPQEEVLHAVGLPSRLQFGTMLKNVMNTAHYRFEYYARQQSPEAQDEARKWAQVMMEAGQKHEKYGATDATDFSKLIQTQFEYMEDPVMDVTSEMLAGAKPLIEAKSGVAETAPLPPDTTPQQRNPNDI